MNGIIINKKLLLVCLLACLLACKRSYAEGIAKEEGDLLLITQQENNINAQKSELPIIEVKNGIVVYPDYSKLPFTAEDQQKVCMDVVIGNYEPIEMYSLSSAPINQEIFLDMMRKKSKIPHDEEKSFCNAPTDENIKALCLDKDSKYRIYNMYKPALNNINCETLLNGQSTAECIVSLTYWDERGKDNEMCWYDYLNIYNKKDKTLMPLIENISKINTSETIIPCSTGKMDIIKVNYHNFLRVTNKDEKDLVSIEHIEKNDLGNWINYPICKY